MTSTLLIDPKGSAGALKTPLQLLPPPACAEVAKALQYGAQKYHPWNWRKARVFCQTYVGAMMRHLQAWQDGEDIDPESGLSHIAHVAASAMIVLDAKAHGTLEDDRPPALGKPLADRSLPPLPSAVSAESPKNTTSSTDGSATVTN